MESIEDRLNREDGQRQAKELAKEQQEPTYKFKFKGRWGGGSRQVGDPAYSQERMQPFPEMTYEEFKESQLIK